MADFKQLEKDIEDLGIVNIAPSGELTPGFVIEAVGAIKQNPLDLDAITKQMKAERKIYAK